MAGRGKVLLVRKGLLMASKVGFWCGAEWALPAGEGGQSPMEGTWHDKGSGKVG